VSTDDLPEVPDGFPWPLIVGIDPGTRLVGYGALVVRRSGPELLASGVLCAPRADVPTRLGWLAEQLETLFARLKPGVVVVEQAFAARNLQSALRIGEGRGVVLAAAARRGVEIVQYAPAVAKKTLVGNGQADKTQVAQMVAAALGLSAVPESLDTSDALALALAHVYKQRVGTSRRPRGQPAP
jgi:crossover junction endodeoxyribonuclease RuvC